MASSQILLFQTTEPQNVRKRLLRFREAFLRLGSNYEFAIVSYSPRARTEVRTVVLDNVKMDHYIFGQDAIDTLGYPSKGAARPFKLIPGNCDLITLLFRKAARNYDQYWVVEDDVDYSGDVHNLLSDLSTRQGDLLASHLAHGYDGWAYSSMLRSPAGNIRPADTWLVFLTFFRISGEALDTIDRYYRDGWSGHSENMWATILKHAGMQVVDFGGDGRYVADEDRNKHYYGLPNDGFHKNGSFGTMNIRMFAGRRKNVLWHPIKQPKVWVRQNGKRLLSIAKWKIAKLGLTSAGKKQPASKV
ncbi:hypothetical protein NX786_07970 [Telluria mixta]|uniref:Uncharacterized protein n=1 Tax=Telluria mixta TaxID=34071 RepID=A0ABT2BXE0_9BURK|nr:hypothetical protein [Telluria mixta]MCS0629266.1 hypothetical protein [Telluria mixta]WEM97702.1 hypothetical protein P0M04_08280 [Telluria mixta]